MRRIPFAQKAIASAALVAMTGQAVAVPTTLSLFHNNDGESKLLGSNGFGGLDGFLGELNGARSAAATAGNDVLTVSSGDNFLAGLAFEASQQRVGSAPAGSLGNGQNYYDALALAAIGYDAITIGNHEFDFGPDVLADFITGYNNAGGAAPFLSANLDFSGEANLAALESAGSIASSTVVVGASGESYGIIGATTENLETVSSPGGVTVGAVAAAVNAEVAALESMGVDRIILSSHLQGLDSEQELISAISGVDVVIAGGGDELLTNTQDALTENPFQPNIDGPYPVISTDTDLDGNSVAIVTTVGEYRYIGELTVDFDMDGNVTGVNGNPILIDPDTATIATGLQNGINIQSEILAPLAEEVAVLEAQVIGSTDVALDGLRASVRGMETNLGNLIADAFVWQAEQVGGLTGAPVIAVSNGGGIRNDGVILPGELTAADIFGILPFANSVVVLNGLTVSDLVSALENSVSDFPGTGGQFLQISGFRFTFSEDDNSIQSITLDDGTLVYTAAGGDLFGGTLDLVTNSFLAGGGDGYDEFAPLNAFDLSVNYGEALRRFIELELEGMVSGDQYPEGGVGRIATAVGVAEPGPLGLMLVGVVALLVRRRVRFKRAIA
ncbi:MAG: 5'-nucleotidase C-terminal domain-containing protein [Pseudomonadota bacterium]